MKIKQFEALVKTYPWLTERVGSRVGLLKIIERPKIRTKFVEFIETRVTSVEVKPWGNLSPWAKPETKKVDGVQTGQQLIIVPHYTLIWNTGQGERSQITNALHIKDASDAQSVGELLAFTIKQNLQSKRIFVEAVLESTLTVTINPDTASQHAFSVYPCPEDWNAQNWLAADDKLVNNIRYRGFSIASSHGAEMIHTS